MEALHQQNIVTFKGFYETGYSFSVAKTIVMRQLLFLFLTFSIACSCKKENRQPTLPVKINPLENAVLLKTGNLFFTGDVHAAGSASIYRQKDGQYLLALQDMDYTSPFDLSVHLSTTSVPANQSVKIFSARTFEGTVFYTIPAALNISSFQQLFLLSDKDANPVASALLQ